VTSDDDGNLATSMTPFDPAAFNTALNLGTAVNNNTAAIANNSAQIANNKEGIAMAMALDAPYVPANKQFAVSGGLGSFEGSQAMAISMGYRFNPNTQLDAGITYGFDKNQVGGRVGVTYAW
jgi:long-subunit fatty acid transport protein